MTALVVAGVALAVFIRTLGNGFVHWGDDQSFVQNPWYRGLGLQQLEWMWTTVHAGHYAPLSWMTLGLDYALWGMNPLGYHLTSAILHAANVVLVYFVALRLFGASGVADRLDRTPRAVLGAAAIAGLTFALHPLRVEPVAWATERRDVLCCCFALGATLAYLRQLDSGVRRMAWYVAALALFAASLLSNRTAIMAPAVFALLNIYPLRRVGGPSGWNTPRARRVYRELAPFAVLALATAALALFARQPATQLSPVEKIAVSVYSLAFYLGKTALPLRLSPLYAMPEHIDPFATRFLVAYAVVAGMCVVAWSARRRWPGATAAWIAFVLITLPMLGVVQSGPQIAADRYTYYAGPVIGIVIGASFAFVFQRYATAACAAAITLLTTLALLTWLQIGVWHDSASLWSQARRVDGALPIAGTASERVPAADVQP